MAVTNTVSSLMRAPDLSVSIATSSAKDTGDKVVSAVAHFNPVHDIPSNALDAKDFPSIDTWLDACIAQGVPGKIGSGTYHVDGQPRYAPVGIYGYGDTPPTIVADTVNTWLYLSDHDVTIKGVNFEGFGNVLAGCVQLTDGSPYHSTTTYAFGRFDPSKGGLALTEAGDINHVSPAVTIEDCKFVNCENAFTFVSDTTQMGTINLHNNVLTGTYGIMDINAPLWTEINATGNEWGNATGDRAQPDVKGNGVQTGFKIGTDFQPVVDGHYTKLNITGNYAHDIESVGTFQDTNAAVFIDARAVNGKTMGDNVISDNTIVHVKGLLGQEDSNAIYAKAQGLIISDNHLEDTGAAYYNAKYNGSETTGILVKPTQSGHASNIQITGNTFVDMPTIPAGVGKDLAVIKVSEGVGEVSISNNTFIGGGNLSTSTNAGLIRYYNTFENLDIIGNKFMNVNIADGAKAIVLNGLSKYGDASIEISHNSAVGTYNANAQWISFVSKTSAPLAIGDNTLGSMYAMTSNRPGTAAISPAIPDSGSSVPNSTNDRMIATLSSTATSFAVSDNRFYVTNDKLYMKAAADDSMASTDQITLAVVAKSAGGVSASQIVVRSTSASASSIDMDLGNNGATIAENATDSQLVAKLPGADFPSVITYSISDPRFVIKNGAIYTATGTTFDYETTSQVQLAITMKAAGATFSESLVVAIGDVNETATSFTASTPSTLMENTAVETKIATLTLTDPDKSQAYTYTTDDSRFYVKNGALYLKAGQVVDYEAQKAIDMKVTASDGTYSVSTGVHLAVGDVLDTVVSAPPPSAPTPTPTPKPPLTPISWPGSTPGVIKGTANADTWTGTSGDDTYFGLAGDDKISGGNGNDTLVGGLGADKLSGGAGIDTASYQAATNGVRASLLKATANTGEAAGDTFSSIENVTGSAHADRLEGDNNANVLNGGNGDDILLGYGGSDTLIGGNGNDIIYGHGGGDTLIGGAGTDTLDGGVGGPDTFVFSGHWDSDTILNFEVGVDKIDLHDAGIDASDLVLTQQQGGVMVTVAGHGTVLLADYNLSQIQVSDFVV